MSGSYGSPASEILSRGRGLVQTQRPAFWLYAALFVVGATLASIGLVGALEGVTAASGLGMAGVILFGAAALWFILQLADLDPKPMSIAAAALLGGALVATSIVQIAAEPLSHVFGTFISDAGVAGAFSAATGEEFYKALVVVLVFLIAPWWWRRPLDGLVFGLLVGLGFQMYEDIIYISGAASAGTGSAGALTVFVDRVLVTGFFSHAVYTAFFGLGFAYAMTAVSASRGKRIGAVVAGSALAWGAHLLWDLPILGSLVDSGLLGTIVYAILKSLPFLLVLIPLVVKAVRDERGFFHRHAQPEIDSGVLGDEDVARLESFGGRIRARREPDGHQARYRLHHLMRAQLDLVRLHLHGFTEPETLEAQRDFIDELKR